MDGSPREIPEERWEPYPGTLCLLAPQRPLLELPGFSAEQRLKPESRAARALARRAMRLLDATRAVEGPIGQGIQAPPQWPDGWVGALSHDRAYVAALVGPSSHFLALGVDLEPAEPLPDDAASLVLDADERALLRALPGGYAQWSRAIFGAKECLHKCANPVHGSWLEFEEVSVRIDPDALSFHCLARSDAAAAALQGASAGRICFRQGRVLTALAYRRQGAPSAPGRTTTAG